MLQKLCLLDFRKEYPSFSIAFSSLQQDICLYAMKGDYMLLNTMK